jgi:hypothetical protein
MHRPATLVRGPLELARGLPEAEQRSVIKSMDDFVDIDDLMEPIVLSPREYQLTPVHHRTEPNDTIMIVSSGGHDPAASSPPTSHK